METAQANTEDRNLAGEVKPPIPAYDPFEERLQSDYRNTRWEFTFDERTSDNRF